MLSVNGRVLFYFAQALSEFDLTFFGFEIGSAEGQQTWEALAVLVGLRVWKSWWHRVRSRLSIKADNMSALAMVAYYKAKGSGVARIAREIALEVADAEFGPDVCAHVPGVVNGVADALSRRYQPGRFFEVPGFLAEAKEVVPPNRSASWFRSLHPPSLW